MIQHIRKHLWNIQETESIKHGIRGCMFELHS